ncbi:hypothetical protein MXB_3518 [Myxobolus squamalis]|nr:hypothetical protein MXB_3518 [Myxobolus squamalis]
MDESFDYLRKSIFFLCQRQVAKTPTGLSQGNLAIQVMWELNPLKILPIFFHYERCTSRAYAP